MLIWTENKNFLVIKMNEFVKYLKNNSIWIKMFIKNAKNLF
jgi:hypothetical protein